MAVLLLFVYEYRQECSELGASAPTSAKAGRLRHLLVVEEAHRVLGKAEPASSFSANPKQKVSEMFSNMISEVRAYGQGILIADQIPCRLNEDAVKNTNLKIVHKLVSADDRAAMATALNLWEDQERVIGDLGVGEVLVRGDMDKQAVMVKVNKQSPEINQAVSQDEIAAGDQGIMFGFASNETDSYMPFAIDCAHRLAKRLEEVRRRDSRLGPDGKTQVTVEYDDGVLKRVDTIVVSTQHSKETTQEELRELIMNEVIRPVVDPKLIDEDTKYFINPSGSFVVGGSWGDSGTTDRKSTR
jgi:S-adenosylmethionine synthetase